MKRNWTDRRCGSLVLPGSVTGYFLGVGGIGSKMSRESLLIWNRPSAAALLRSKAQLQMQVSQIGREGSQTLNGVVSLLLAIFCQKTKKIAWKWQKETKTGVCQWRIQVPPPTDQHFLNFMQIFFGEIGKIICCCPPVGIIRWVPLLSSLYKVGDLPGRSRSVRDCAALDHQGESPCGETSA